MRALLPVAVVAALVAVAPAGAVATAEPVQTYAIDGAKSKASFGVQHVFVERVTGALPIQSGSVTRSPNALIPQSATAVLDATKLVSGDSDRDASLQSADFFEVKKFPTWTFTSTKIVPQGEAAFGMDGTLTMHGVTQPEHLDVVVHGDAAHPVYHAVGHIDRHAFGMSVTRLDPAIGSTVDVTLDVTLR